MALDIVRTQEMYNTTESAPFTDFQLSEHNKDRPRGAVAGSSCCLACQSTTALCELRTTIRVPNRLSPTTSPVVGVVADDIPILACRERTILSILREPNHGLLKSRLNIS